MLERKGRSIDIGFSERENVLVVCSNPGVLRAILFTRSNSLISLGMLLVV